MSSSGTWRADLERAMRIDREAKRPPWVQMATVKADGKPANRTMVFRGFMNGTDRLLFTTDGRSAKAGEVSANGCWVEACWYLTEAREQFRIAGVVVCHGEGAEGIAGDERGRVWSELSVETRGSFFWPVPGSPRKGVEEELRTPSELSLEEPPACFCLMELEPLHLDHLDLKSTPHRRRVHTRNETGHWSLVEVYP